MKGATRHYDALWCSIIVIVAVTVGGVAPSAQSAGEPMGSMYTVGTNERARTSTTGRRRRCSTSWTSTTIASRWA